MTADFGILLLCGILCAGGVFLLLDRTLLRVILGLMLLPNGINLLILAMGGPPKNPPILGRGGLEDAGAVRGVVAARGVGRAGEDAGAHLEVVGELVGALAGRRLLDDRVDPRGVRIRPRLDPERPHAGGVGEEEPVHGVGVLAADHRGPGGVPTRSPHVQAHRVHVVALAPHRGRDRHHLSDHGLGREPSACDERFHLVDSQSVPHAGPPRSAVGGHVPLDASEAAARVRGRRPSGAAPSFSGGVPCACPREPPGRC